MISARPFCAESPAELALALRRLSIPADAGEYLLERIPHAQVLISGLGRDEARHLHRLVSSGDSPGREEFPFLVAGEISRAPDCALLGGRRDQFERLVRALRTREEGSLKQLARAVERAVLGAFSPSRTLALAGRSFDFSERSGLMGVVNVTPDSFSDGGRFVDTAAAIAHGIALAEAGADLVDVGGESTRPGAQPVGPAEEEARVVPVIRGLRERLPKLPISIDTTKASVARAAVGAGASMINDISGLHFEPELARVAAETGASLCLMHIQGAPRTMQAAPQYKDLLAEVKGFLEEGLERARAAGIPEERLCVDPGIGFGKTFAHNLFLLRRLGELRSLGRPLLVGTSRKAFLGHLVGGKPPAERVVATVASVAALAAQGTGDIFRVHDVAEVREALLVVDALRTACDGGEVMVGGEASSKGQEG